MCNVIWDVIKILHFWAIKPLFTKSEDSFLSQAKITIRQIKPYLHFDAWFFIWYGDDFSELYFFITGVDLPPTEFTITSKNKYLQKHFLILNDIFIKSLKFLAFYLRPPTVTSWKKEIQHKIAKKLSSYADVCLCVLKLKQELSIKWLENIYLHCTLPKFYEIFLNVLMLLCFLMYQVCIQWYLVSYGCTYFHGRKENVKSSLKYLRFLHA